MPFHQAGLDVLTTDLLNRPNSIKLPIILEVAKTQGHPKIEEAVSLRLI